MTETGDIQMQTFSVTKKVQTLALPVPRLCPPEWCLNTVLLSSLQRDCSDNVEASVVLTGASREGGGASAVRRVCPDAGFKCARVRQVSWISCRSQWWLL